MSRSVSTTRTIPPCGTRECFAAHHDRPGLWCISVRWSIPIDGHLTPAPRRFIMRRLFCAAAIAALAFTGLNAGVSDAATATSVAPYVDMGAWPTPVLSTMASKGNVRSFTLGFVTSYGCKASWFGAYDPRTGWQRDEINKLRAAGGDVKISFGGASGIELAYYCTTPTTLANEYDAVVNAYALKAVDFDIEGAAVADPGTIARRSSALKILQDRHPGLKISLTLPVL